jgi:hypothetical protein
MMGRIIINKAVGQLKSLQLDNPGLYIAHVTSGNGKTLATKKFIIK